MGEESGFQRPRQGVNANENREIPEPPFAVSHRLANPPSDAVGFILPRGKRDHGDRLAIWVIGGQLLGFALTVVSDQMAGGCQNRLGAPIILLQGNDPRAGKIPLEIKNIADVRATPFVNALIRIAYHAQVWLVDGKTASDRVLGLIGILIFIDQYKLEAAIKIFAKLLIVLESQCRPKKQVVEIEGVRLAHLFLIERVDARHGLGEKVVGL